VFECRFAYHMRSLRLNDGRCRVVGHCTVQQSEIRVHGHATVDDRHGDVGFSGTFESVKIQCFRYVTIVIDGHHHAVEHRTNNILYSCGM